METNYNSKDPILCQKAEELLLSELLRSLGLSISKAYVEMLRGRIWVESEEGKGSKFYFTVPMFLNQS